MSATRIYIIKIAPELYEARLGSEEGPVLFTGKEALVPACGILKARGINGPYEGWSPAADKPTMRLSLDGEELIMARHEPPVLTEEERFRFYEPGEDIR